MANYYLDIESSSLSPADGEIISIQYQLLDFDTKEAAGPLIILKAWESSEKDILEKFAQAFGQDTWSFIAHGYNLKFEHDFLKHRAIANGLEPIDLLSRPSIDLHPCGIMLNGGQFKGSGLDKISGKNGNGSSVIEYIKNKEYDKIEAYIIQETESYIELLTYLVKRMPEVLQDFKELNNEK